MTEKIVGLDNPELNQEANDIWDRIAGPWDEDFGPDGNQHNAYITDPVTDRLLDLKQGETVLDIACGAGRYARRNIEGDHSTGTSRHTITSWDYLDATPDMGLSVRNQAEKQYFSDRPIGMLLNAFFEHGLVMDRLEEPVFPDEVENPRPTGWANFKLIPFSMVCRMRRIAV